MTSSLALQACAFTTCSSMLCDLSSCVEIVAISEHTEATPHNRRHDGEDNPGRREPCGERCPPIAGPAVSAAARLPPEPLC
jgi:hypothetical protein